MIKSNLPVLMAQNQIRTVAELSKRTKISRATLTTLYYGTGKGVQFDTLINLCRFFNCTISEIIEYREDVG